MDYKQQKIKPYGTEKAKVEEVEMMFDNIAPTYDKLNLLLSLGVDRQWRKATIKYLKKKRPNKVLDVATGTGDFAVLVAQKVNPEKIYAVDISEGMMEIGREKVKSENLDDVITFQKEDCLNLTFPDESFDAVTVSFGIRNFENLDKSLSEILRVLKKGGDLVILELTTPDKTPMKQLFNFYSKVIIRKIGAMISKDKAAYDYLPKTMDAFPQGEKMQDILYGLGYEKVFFKRMTFGICTMYVATK